MKRVSLFTLATLFFIACDDAPQAVDDEQFGVFSVSLTPAGDTLEVGSTVQLSAQATDANGVLLSGIEFMWSSTDPAVATVTPQGVASAISPGGAFITATAEGKSGMAALTVWIVGDLLSVAGDGQVGSLGHPISDPLIVKVADPSGDGLPGVNVRWSVSSLGRVLSSQTDAAGLARAFWTLGLNTGDQTATVQRATASASLSGVGSLIFTATTPPLVPLTDMGTSTYFGFPGGLYPGGNVMPQQYFDAGRAFAAAVEPLDVDGNPSTDGKYVLLSIGHSVAEQIYCFERPCPPFTFTGKALADPDVDKTNLAIVEGAYGGRTTEFWDSPDRADYARIRSNELLPQGLSEQQVQVVWLQVLDRQWSDFPANAYGMVSNIGNIMRALRSRYPNLRLVFLASSLYGGWIEAENISWRLKEPSTYETGFAMKWLIQAQIDQMASGGTIVDERAGDLNYNTVAPWIGWGAYFWADGVNPRSDGHFWSIGDFLPGDVHLTQSGREKAAGLLLTFFKTSPQTRCWFLTGETC